MGIGIVTIRSIEGVHGRQIQLRSVPSINAYERNTNHPAEDVAHDRVIADLLACPFCGGKANYAINSHHQWNNKPTFEIWCFCTRAWVIEGDLEAAVRAWNQRNNPF